MPPNRKQLSTGLISVDFSSHFVANSKYQPLTSRPVEQSQEPKTTLTRNQEHKKDSTGENKELQRILKEEEARQLVSCDNIVANLITDASQCGQSSHVTCEEPSSDSYWDMPSEETHETDYFSVGQLERNLIEDAVERVHNAKKTVTAAHVHDGNHPNQSYWDWESSPISSEEKSSQIIEAILRDERIRQLLSIESLSLNETSVPTVKAFAPEIKNPSLANGSSQDYWDWSEEEKVEEAAHVNDPSHPNHQYWDFPSKPEDETSNKKLLIDMILEHEEIRQILCCHAVENREKSSRPLNNCNKVKHQVSNLPAPFECYWDFHTNVQKKSQEVSKNDLIDKILLEHRALEATSTDLIVENLKNDYHADRQRQLAPTSINTDQQPSYWDW